MCAPETSQARSETSKSERPASPTMAVAVTTPRQSHPGPRGTSSASHTPTHTQAQVYIRDVSLSVSATGRAQLQLFQAPTSSQRARSIAGGLADRFARASPQHSENAPPSRRTSISTSNVRGESLTNDVSTMTLGSPIRVRKFLAFPTEISSGSGVAFQGFKRPQGKDEEVLEESRIEEGREISPSPTYSPGRELLKEYTMASPSPLRKRSNMAKPVQPRLLPLRTPPSKPEISQLATSVTELLSSAQFLPDKWLPTLSRLVQEGKSALAGTHMGPSHIASLIEKGEKAEEQEIVLAACRKRKHASSGQIQDSKEVRSQSKPEDPSTSSRDMITRKEENPFSLPLELRSIDPSSLAFEKTAQWLAQNAANDGEGPNEIDDQNATPVNNKRRKGRPKGSKTKTRRLSEVSIPEEQEDIEVPFEETSTSEARDRVVGQSWKDAP